MTTGSKNSDDRVYGSWFDNGAYSGTAWVGSYSSKTWSGVDGIIPTKPDPSTKRFYSIPVTVKRKNGKFKTTIRRYGFYPKRPKVFKEPNYYTMSASRFVSTNASGLKLVGDYGGDRTFTGNVSLARIFDYSLPSPPSWTSNDDIDLVLKLKEKVNGSDFNLSVFLGEAHQTVQLIGDIAVRLGRSAHALRHGRVVEAAHYVFTSDEGRQRVLRKKFGDAELAVQYGWKPLLKDMHDAAVMLAHQLHVPHYQRYTVIKTKTVPKAQIKAYNVYYDWSAGVSSVSKRLVAFFHEDPANIPNLSGVMDPELVAWELLPWSFVADWVSPIGDYMEARAFASKLQGKFVTTTVNKRIYEGLTLGKTYERVPGYPSHYESPPVDHRGRSISLTREITTSLAVPKPKVKTVDKAASFTHCINALALMASAFRGGPRGPGIHQGRPITDKSWDKLKFRLDNPYSERKKNALARAEARLYS